MTTADYLTSLQNDLNKINTILELEEGTNFTNIANMVESGDISKGGASLDEYFTSTISGGSDYSSPGYLKTLKNFPALSFNGDSCAYMFYGFQGESIDFSKFDTSNATSFTYMFNGCSNLTELDLSNFDTSKATNMSSMFLGSSNLKKLNCSGWDFSSISQFSGIFSGMMRIEEIILENANFGNLTSLANGFQNLSSLLRIKLNGTTNEKITNMSYLFSGCSSLQLIDIRDFTFNQVTTYSSMLNRVPATCVIVVKSNTEKQWFNTNFPFYTNVKTVEEYEA